MFLTAGGENYGVVVLVVVCVCVCESDGGVVESKEEEVPPRFVVDCVRERSVVNFRYIIVFLSITFSCERLPASILKIKALSSAARYDTCN